jgi:hypothetical protein
MKEVDWKQFIEESKNRDMGTYGNRYNDLVKDLVDSEVLSFEPEGNYQLTGSGVVVSPRSHISVLYFTRKSDALKYSTIKWENALYDIEISKIEKVFIPKRGDSDEG